MSSNRTGKRVDGNPSRPAYDNPTGDKGGLAAGNNRVRNQAADEVSRDRPAMKRSRSRPIGHASDRKLGQKPAG